MIGASKADEIDLESGETLYPGISYGENQLRWGFIRKGYGILAAQLVLTTVVSAFMVLSTPVNEPRRARRAYTSGTGTNLPSRDERRRCETPASGAAAAVRGERTPASKPAKQQR